MIVGPMKKTSAYTMSGRYSSGALKGLSVHCRLLSGHGRAGREAPRDDARPAMRRRSRVGGCRADVGQGRFAVFFDGQITERENADRTAVLHNGQSANGVLPH